MKFPLDRDVTNPLESGGLYGTLRGIRSISMEGARMRSIEHEKMDLLAGFFRPPLSR